MHRNKTPLIRAVLSECQQSMTSTAAKCNIRVQMQKGSSRHSWGCSKSCDVKWQSLSDLDVAMTFCGVNGAGRGRRRGRSRGAYMELQLPHACIYPATPAQANSATHAVISTPEATNTE